MTKRPLIGAHCKGGLKGALEHAKEIGAQSIQVFIGSPRTWKRPSIGEREGAAFHESVVAAGLGPVFVHGNYLVNLASPSTTFFERSLETLCLELASADHAGADGLIIHPGSSGPDPEEKGLERIIGAIQQAFRQYEGKCRLVLEVCAGQGNTIGDRFEEIAYILEAMQHDERLAVCWETCHLYNAGYDVSTVAGLRKTIQQFEDIIGFEWLVAVHANDSKTPFHARRDRHENIGEGHIGPEAFRRMLRHPKLKHLPWILEVPGFENEGPDQKNIQILKDLAGV